MTEVSLKFPDGSVRAYPAGATGKDVAESISKSLAKKAVAVTLNGDLADLSTPVTDGAAIEQQTKRLTQVTDAFAARRMDASVKAALAGRRLNEIEE